jgi:hypothetical protein
MHREHGLPLNVGKASSQIDISRFMDFHGILIPALKQSHAKGIA